jgi:hypothetical protein
MEEGSAVSRLMIAIVMATGAVALVQNAPPSAAKGTPSNSSRYQYGSR